MDKSEVSTITGASTSCPLNNPSVEAGQLELDFSETPTPTTADLTTSTKEPLWKPDGLNKMKLNAMVAIRQPSPQASTSTAQSSSASPASLAAELSEQDITSTGGTTPPAIVQTPEPADPRVTLSIQETASSNDTTASTTASIPQWNAKDSPFPAHYTTVQIEITVRLSKMYADAQAANIAAVSSNSNNLTASAEPPITLGMSSTDFLNSRSPMTEPSSQNQKKKPRTPLPNGPLGRQQGTQASTSSRAASRESARTSGSQTIQENQSQAGLSTSTCSQRASYGGYTLDDLGLKPGYFPDLIVPIGGEQPPPKGNSKDIPSWAFLIFSVLKKVPGGMMKMDHLRGAVMEWCPAILQKAERDDPTKWERYRTALKKYNDSQAGPEPKATKPPKEPKSPQQVCNDSCRHCLTSYDEFKNVKVGASNAGYWRIREEEKVSTLKVKKAPLKEEAEGESFGSIFGSSMNSATHASSNMDVDDDGEDHDERIMEEESESRNSLETSRSHSRGEEPVSQSLPLPPPRGKRARKPTVPFEGGENSAKRLKKER